MQPFARLAQANKIEIIDVRPPHSLYDFVDQRFNGLEVLRRLLTQARCHGVQTIVVEELEDSIDLDEEKEDIRIAIGAASVHRTHRIGLFTDFFIHQSHVKKLTNESFIGYVVIRRDSAREKRHGYYIYESVIKKSKHVHNYVRGEQNWICSCADNKFTVRGYLYAQQNGITTSCAHTSLRTAAAPFLNGLDLSYRRINALVGIDHIKRKGSDGLNSTEMANVLETIGIGCFIGDFRPQSNLTQPAPFERVVYSSIESGFPAIVFFRTRNNTNHAIPIFGHTFNEDTWVPNAERYYFNESDSPCLYSDAWLSMFIGHDDNVGSNICIPKHYLHSKRPKMSSEADESTAVSFIISTVPKSTRVYFTKAEATAFEMIRTIMNQANNRRNDPWLDSWLTRLSDSFGKQQTVMRPLLISSNDYINHLRHITDWNRQTVLPDGLLEIEGWLAEGPIWMVEFSLPELFSATKRKIAEVLMKADQQEDVQDLTNIIAARLPGYFAIPMDTAGAAKSALFKFIPSGLTKHTEAYGCEGFTRGQR